MALNVRLLESLLEKYRPAKISMPALRAHYGDLLADLPPSEYPKRERTSDDQVLEFITQHLRANGKVGHTALLRAYRAGGLACEQSRFRELFRELVAAETSQSK